MATGDIGAIEYVDEDTGEVIRKMVTLHAPRNRKPNKPKKRLYDSWVVLNQTNDGGLKKLFLDERIGRCDRDVLFGVISFMCIGNTVHVRQSDIGRLMGINQPSVSKSIKNLVAAGYMVKENDYYRLDKGFCYRGKWSDF